MEPGGDDLQDELIIDESIASSEEDESSHFIPEISQDSEDDRAGSSSNAVGSASFLAKKRKRKAKEKERKAKVRLWGGFLSSTFYADCL